MCARAAESPSTLISAHNVSDKNVNPQTKSEIRDKGAAKSQAGRETIVHNLGINLLPNPVYVPVQGDRTGYRAGNREKLNSTQAEPGQAITSAVAYFPSISCATFCPVALYFFEHFFG